MKKTVPIVIGNWKLNPVTVSEASELAQGIARKLKKTPEPYVVVAPPHTYLQEVGKRVSKGSVALASQDISSQVIGAHTGEVSALQLKDLGVEFSIIGHSERRAAGEKDVDVQQKTLVALKNRLVPVVCVGESDRDDQGNFFTFVEAQLRSLGAVLTAIQIKKVIIAYEPIWAIGTGNTATADDVKEMQLFIESVLTKIFDRPTAKAVRLIYGGSVKPQNAKELHAEGGMKGFLVGGASLSVDSFVEIVKEVS